MARRYISNHKSKPPGPLVSSWPDLPAPVQQHRKLWRYEVVDSEGFVFLKTKDRDEAYRYKNLMTTGHHPLFVDRHEPSETLIHEQRQQEKSEWRWNSGFGA